MTVRSIRSALSRHIGWALSWATVAAVWFLPCSAGAAPEDLCYQGGEPASRHPVDWIPLMKLTVRSFVAAILAVPVKIIQRRSYSLLFSALLVAPTLAESALHECRRTDSSPCSVVGTWQFGWLTSVDFFWSDASTGVAQIAELWSGWKAAQPTPIVDFGCFPSGMLDTVSSGIRTVHCQFQFEGEPPWKMHWKVLSWHATVYVPELENYWDSALEQDVCPTGRLKKLLPAGLLSPIKPVWACVFERERLRPNRSCGVGNPIFPLTGAKRQEVYVNLGGHFGQVAIVYDSSAKLTTSTGEVGFGPAAAVSLGGLWSTTLHRNLVFQLDADGQAAVVLAGRGGGAWVSFVRQNQGTYSSPLGISDRIQSSGGSWIYFDAANSMVETYASTGRLVQAANAQGKVFNYLYSSASTPAVVAPKAGLLISVQDSFGRSVQLNYEQPAVPTDHPRLTKIVDSAGGVTSINYDTTYPIAITWPDGTTRQFVYELTDLPWALTGIVDELNTRFSRYGYDANGRAISTELTNAVDRYTVNWSLPPQLNISITWEGLTGTIWREHSWTLPDGISVQNPNGAGSNDVAILINGIPQLISRSQPAGSGCAASTRSMSYDASGNIARQDDFNGNRICYEYGQSRNLETVRVEGLNSAATCSVLTGLWAALPGGSRKINTQWHPHRQLQTKKAEPGRMTTYVYSGQPDPFAGFVQASCEPASALLPDGRPIAVLCKQVEQATTDVDGSLGFFAAFQAGVAARTQTWTYNQFGQVLSHNGPRTDVNDVTTYTYYSDSTAAHTLGDLATVTNALGKVTQYTKYNSHGQVRESVDPNGVLTLNAYDPRQRLVSTSVGGLTTSYTYDAVGQLIRITRPDASYLGYAYDAAHRQVAVFDNLGNRVDYTLDNAGNRVAQSAKDPGGTLRRQLARSFDALGRVQQTVGRE